MNIFNKLFGKKEPVEPIKPPISKKKEEQKQFTEAELISKIEDLKKEITDQIGEGKYSITLSPAKYGFRIDFLLYVKENEPTYNYLCDKLYWGFVMQFHESNTFYQISYEGILEVCEEIANENEIYVKITEWSAGNIRLSRGSLYELAMEKVGLCNNRWGSF